MFQTYDLFMLMVCVLKYLRYVKGHLQSTNINSEISAVSGAAL